MNLKTDILIKDISVPASEQIRVSTLNVLNSLTMLEDRISWFSEDLKQVKPDILMLQEVMFETPGKSKSLDTITSHTDLKIVSALDQSDLRPDSYLSGIAILSSLPVMEEGTLFVGKQFPRASQPLVAYAVLEARPGVAFIAVTGHLHWGGEQEYSRFMQMVDVNRFVTGLMDKYRDMNPVAVFGGDFNSLPDSESLRYMKGLASAPDHTGAFWVDPFDMFNGEEPAGTVVADNHWAKQTGRSKNILLSHLIPDRRIDYLLSYGWVYGKHGTPLSYQRCFDGLYGEGQFPISDHYGLTVDYWVR